MKKVKSIRAWAVVLFVILLLQFILVTGVTEASPTNQTNSSNVQDPDNDVIPRCKDETLRAPVDPEAALRKSRGPRSRDDGDSKLIYVPVVYHVLRTFNGGNGNIPVDSLLQGINALNEAYAGYEFQNTRLESGFRFFLQGIVYWNNDEYFFRCETFHDMIKQATAVRQDAVINVYTCMLGYLGFAFLPSTVESSYGVTINYLTFPPSKVDNSYVPNRLYKKSFTLVHEVGHCLGLLHTFDGGCSGTDAADTAPEAQPYYGTCNPQQPQQMAPDSCPTDQNPDPINNFMDYSQDDCMLIFTPGQVQKMQTQVATYKPNIFTMSTPLMCYASGRVGPAPRYALCVDDGRPLFEPTPDGSPVPEEGWCYTRGSVTSWGSTCCAGDCDDFNEVKSLFPSEVIPTQTPTPAVAPSAVIDPKTCLSKATWKGAKAQCNKKGLKLCSSDDLRAGLINTALSRGKKNSLPKCNVLFTRKLWTSTTCPDSGNPSTILLGPSSGTVVQTCNKRNKLFSFVCCRIRH